MAFKKEYKEGYNAAIEAIKKALAGQISSMGSNGNHQSDGRDMDLSGTPAGEAMNQSSQSGSSAGSSGSSGASSSSGRGNGSQGTVTPGDCSGQFGSNTPKTPGGFMPASEGNKLAEKEGYPAGPTDEANSSGWKEVAIKAAQKNKSSNAGSLISKIYSIYKTTTDWGKAFKKIIGHSLNTQDKRQAYTDKNILATRNMISRTEKDKFDCIDYICIFTDSSGSVSDEDLRFMLSEIYNIAYSLKPETLVVGQFDTRITDIQIFNSPKDFKKYTKNASVKGRGGTNCKCIWDLLKTDKRFTRHSAELVIIITDGELGQYKRDPKTMNNLCWVILDNSRWDVENKDTKTTCVHLNSQDIKK